MVASSGSGADRMKVRRRTPREIADAKRGKPRGAFSSKYPWRSRLHGIVLPHVT
jgi:hypothetical protein